MPRSETLTPAQRSMRARLGAYALHLKHDPKKTTEKAREAFMTRFLDEVDPDRALPEDERNRRAELARKAYFTRLAMASSLARSRKVAS